MAAIVGVLGSCGVLSGPVAGVKLASHYVVLRIMNLVRHAHDSAGY